MEREGNESEGDAEVATDDQESDEEYENQVSKMKGTYRKPLGMEKKIWNRKVALMRSLTMRIDKRNWNIVANINGDVGQKLGRLSLQKKQKVISLNQMMLKMVKMKNVMLECEKTPEVMNVVTRNVMVRVK